MPNESADYLWEKFHNLRVKVRVNRDYQMNRQRSLEFRDNAIKAMSILCGSVVFSSVANPDVLRVCAVIVTVGSTASLVFGFGNKARDAARRSGEWSSLEREIEERGERDFTETDLTRWAARACDIESGEPPPNRRLLEACIQRALESTGSPDHRKLKWHERLPAVFVA